MEDPVFDLINEEDDHDETERFDNYLEDMKARGCYASLAGVINDYMKSTQHDSEEQPEEIHAVDDSEKSDAPQGG